MKIFNNKLFKNYFMISISLFISEMIFKGVCNLPLFDWSILRIFIGCNILGLIFGFLYSFLKRETGNLLSFITVLFFSLYGVLQAGLYNYLGSFQSIGSLKNFTLANYYYEELFNSIGFGLWFILLPVVFVGIYYLFIDRKVKILEINNIIDFADKFDSDERKVMNEQSKLKKLKRSNIADKIAGGVVLIVLIGLFYVTLIVPFFESSYQIFRLGELFNNPLNPNPLVDQVGYNMYLFSDAKYQLFPSNKILSHNYDEASKKEQSNDKDAREIDDYVWEQIIDNEKNSNYKVLNNYYISKEITDKNEFTGMFKNKNVIVIMAESLNDLAINEEYFPNIYKLYNEGWSWSNSYSPRSSCSTANSEVSGITSMYTLNNSCTVRTNLMNQYSQSIFGLFNDAGYNTYGFHNYSNEYYNRTTYFKNMGAKNYYGAQEMGIAYNSSYNEWPSESDMMSKVLDYVQDDRKFMVWISTTSTHQPYSVNSELGDKNLDLFEGSSYNTSVKRYLSKVKDLDDSIGILLNGLESQGKLENTVIVLYSDHYPYALDSDDYNSLLDYDVTKEGNRDRTPFIIYNSNMSSKKYDTYTTYMNIVPTVANLFDLEYDPRLYSGYDILSKDYENRAVFADGSWKDSKGYYNASTGRILFYNDNDTYDKDEIKEINSDIRDRIYMSNLAIKTNYFKYLYGKYDEYKVDDLNNTTE